jgi:hypothetical protein
MNPTPHASMSAAQRDPRTGRRRRTALLLVAGIAVVLVAVVAGAAASGLFRSPTDRQSMAKSLAQGIQVSASVSGSSLDATSAIADFGLEAGVRLVRVRILDHVELHLRLAAGQTVVLADRPRVCLVGPLSAPDDAGLSDRCWGTPDLGDAVASAISADANGHPRLDAGQAIDVSAALERGDIRCDYPPGDWALEITVNPLVDGTAAGPVELDPITVPIPLEPAGTALPLLGIDQTRYCGLAARIYNDQGEPTVAATP